MLKEVYADDGYTCRTWRHIVVNILSGALDDATGVWAGRDAGKLIEAEYGPKIGVLTVILPTARLPSGQFRQEAAKAMWSAKDRTVAAATVIPGEGFRASALRAAFSTLHLVSGSKLATSLETTVEPAARFLLMETLKEAPRADIRELTAVTEDAMGPLTSDPGLA